MTTLPGDLGSPGHSVVTLFACPSTYAPGEVDDGLSGPPEVAARAEITAARHCRRFTRRRFGGKRRMMSSTSTIEARAGKAGLRQPPAWPGTVWRMPMGLDIVIRDAAPTGLPREKPPYGKPGAVGRLHRLIARNSGEYIFVGVRGGSGAPSVREPASDVFLGPGDICFYDVHRPPQLDVPARSRMKVFLLPRELLGLEDSDLHQITNAPVTRTSGMGALLSPFLSDLADTAAVSQPPVVKMLAWNAVDLLATLAREHLSEHATGTPHDQAPLMSAIREFIDLHLSDVDLSPQTIAKANRISVRYLHKLFKDEGTTVGRWIRRRRLEECRRALTFRPRGNQTIAAVANRWGFQSATHFSRVFRAAYGMSPREWRDIIGRGSTAVRD
ncbi:helix-turn-helix domain-containing protein [Streptomyces asiaticus]